MPTTDIVSPWVFGLAKGDVGSINLGSLGMRINELDVNNLRQFNMPRTTSQLSQGPNTRIIDILQITRGWDLTGKASGRPFAYNARTNLYRFMESGDTQANPLRFTYLGSSFTVAESRLAVQENSGEIDIFNIEMQLIAGSPRA